MRISGGFAPEGSVPSTRRGIDPSDYVSGRLPRRPRGAYALAVAWVVVALILYAVQVLNLLVG
jgi:hypothetical protein